MTYYGIVNTVKENEKGIYGAKSNLVSKFIGYSPTTYLLSSVAKAFGDDVMEKVQKSSKGELTQINIDQVSKTKRNHISKLSSNKDAIILSNIILNNNYNISNNLNIFYGLFDDKLIKNNAFKKIMKSYGGSDLIICERNKLPNNLKHYGGSDAVFNTGLYFTHPKDSTILIPLNNSNNLIKTLILEETISAYEALGAKKMIIKDVTTINSNNGGKDSKIKINLNGNSEKTVLREKYFGKGIYDPNRAKEGKMFIYDFPSIMTTINSRINGNQTIENFTENINLSIGLDVDILNLFQANSNFEYNRIWNFEVEFYDKNEL